MLHCYIIFKTSCQNVISYLRIIPSTIPRTQPKLHPVNNPSTPSCGTQPDGARASRTHATLKVTDGFVNGTSIWHLPKRSWFTAWSQVILGGWKQVGSQTVLKLAANPLPQKWFEGHSKVRQHHEASINIEGWIHRSHQGKEHDKHGYASMCSQNVASRKWQTFIKIHPKTLYINPSIWTTPTLIKWHSWPCCLPGLRPTNGIKQPIFQRVTRSSTATLLPAPSQSFPLKSDTPPRRQNVSVTRACSLRLFLGFAKRGTYGRHQFVEVALSS